MKKRKLYNFLIILLLYLAVSCIPLELFIKDNLSLCLWIRIGIQIVFLITSYLIILFKTDFAVTLKKINIKYLLLLIPTVIVVASNFLYFGFQKSDFVYGNDPNIVLKIFLTLFVVLNEEFIFRLIFINSLEKHNNWGKILISAGVFGICHLTSFLSTFNPMDLIIPVYTFAFGVLLGIIYTKTNSIGMCAIFHLLFNIVNLYLFEMFIANGISNYGIYILANAIVVVAVCLYLLMLILTKQLVINDEKKELL